MTLSDIATKARFMTSTDTTSYPNANLLIDLNVWYQKVVSMILESADQSDFDDNNATNYPTATRPLIASQRDYSFNTDVWTLAGIEGASGTASQTLLPLKIKRLDVTYDGTNWFPATPFDDGTFVFGLGNDAQVDEDFTNDAPQYSVKYNSIFLYPMASAANVTAGAMMRLEQQRNVIPFTLTELTTGTEVPGFDAPFHPILAEGCALEYGRARNYPQVADWEKSVADWELRIRTAYGRKELDRRPQLLGIADDTTFR